MKLSLKPRVIRSWRYVKKHVPRMNKTRRRASSRMISSPFKTPFKPTALPKSSIPVDQGKLLKKLRIPILHWADDSSDSDIVSEITTSKPVECHAKLMLTKINNTLLNEARDTANRVNPSKPFQMDPKKEDNIELIRSQFKLTGELESFASGGFGEVFKARSEENTQFAIKLVACKYGNEKYHAYWKKSASHEPEIHRLMNHRNVVRMVDTLWLDSEVSSPGYLAMKLECMDMDLGHFVKLFRPVQSAATLRRLAIQALSGLAHIHSHFVAHHDLKPANMLVQIPNFSWQKTDAEIMKLLKHATVKITDFGIAQLYSSENSLETQSCGGTRVYTAPEKLELDKKECRPNHSYDPYKSDLYSMGMSLFQIATGQIPKDEYRLPLARRTLNPRNSCRAAIISMLWPCEKRPTVKKALKMLKDNTMFSY